MNIKELLIGASLYLLGQILVWYQINGQFISTWIKEHPWAMSLCGIPISYIYIYATYYTVQAFDGDFTREFFPEDHSDDVMGWQDRGQINALMLLIQSKK